MPSEAADWGSVPEWISGIGTVLAFAIALWLALWQERLRRRSELEEQTRQARLVVVSEPAMSTEDGEPLALFVKVTNYSSEPIYDVTLRLVVTRALSQRGAAGQTAEWLVLPPGETAESGFAIPPGDGRVTSGTPVVGFTDASGRRWERVCGFIEPKRMVGEHWRLAR